LGQSSPLFICLIAVYRVRALSIKIELVHSCIVKVETIGCFCWSRNSLVGVLERCLGQIKTRHGDTALGERVLKVVEEEERRFATLSDFAWVVPWNAR